LQDESPITVDDIPDLTSTASREVLPTWKRTAKINVPKKDMLSPLPNTPTYFQDESPITLSANMTTSQVLRGWADSLVEPGANAIFALSKNGRLDDTRISLSDNLDESLVYDWGDSLMDRDGPVVHAVGLISKADEIPFLLNGSFGDDTCVEAFSVFSRDQLKDDGRGSLRNKIEEMYGKLQGQLWIQLWWGRADKHIPVLKIGGLMAAPGLPEDSARVLLYKINKYARKERKIVVLSKRAYISRDGTDLTEFYVRLGFEKLMMEEGLYELVYTRVGSSSAAEPQRLNLESAKQQMMVGMNL